MILKFNVSRAWGQKSDCSQNKLCKGNVILDRSVEMSEGISFSVTAKTLWPK